MHKFTSVEIYVYKIEHKITMMSEVTKNILSSTAIVNETVKLAIIDQWVGSITQDGSVIFNLNEPNFFRIS